MGAQIGWIAFGNFITLLQNGADASSCFFGSLWRRAGTGLPRATDLTEGVRLLDGAQKSLARLR